MKHCECDEDSSNNPNPPELYEAETERPYYKHLPGECGCTIGLKSYMRRGKLVTLCSCCNLTTDILV